MRLDGLEHDLRPLWRKALGYFIWNRARIRGMAFTRAEAGAKPP